MISNSLQLKSLLLAFLFALPGPAHFCCFAQSQTAASGNGNKQAPPQDIGWPRQITKDGATLVYYQPQIDDWKDKKRIFTRVAFQLTPSGGKPVMGVASIEANTVVNQDSQTAYLQDIQVK